MIDPTYERAQIATNPAWELAFNISEFQNDNAPLGWSRYISLAEYLLANYQIKRKAQP